MWNSLSKPWKACFEEAWDSYCNGSIPIGAVLVDQNDNIISRGRNRINESIAPRNQTCSNKLAHAEINVLLQIDKSFKITADYVLYTTTEPCVLCFGAIVMSGVRKISYAAKDPLAGGTNLNNSDNLFIRGRGIEIVHAGKLLANIQRVIRTEYVLRYLDSERAKELLENYKIDYPAAVALGEHWYNNGRLNEMKTSDISFESVFNELCKELRDYGGSFKEVDSFG
jgi:tRNA(adenine34) deaminase